MAVDSRAWNLLAGLTVAAGCGGRTIASDGDSTNSTNDGETGPETGPESGPECVDDGDCPYGYYCYDGVCEYGPVWDGHIPYYECNADADCGSLELCEFNYCESVYSPPACDLVIPLSQVVEISEPVLALAFVDVDVDGADELVVATATQLHVFESGSPMPVSHPRGSESLGVHAMVGGAFDDVPGEDVMILQFDQLDLHASDGLGTLAPAVSMPSPYPDSRGLEPGSFDDEPTTDVLVWGEVSTGVRYGDGGSLGLLGGNVTSASARDLGLPGNGFTVLRDGELLFVDIGGLMPFILGSVALYGDTPHAQTGVDALGDTLEAGTSNVAGWTLVQMFDRASSGQVSRWGLPGTVTHMRAVDLDGLDENDEIALFVDDGLVLLLNGPGQCLLPVPFRDAAGELAVGDHDGDGDEELAIRVGTNRLSIVDVE